MAAEDRTAAGCRPILQMSYYQEFYDYVQKTPGESLSKTNRILFNNFVTENLIQPLLIDKNKIPLTTSDLKRVEDFATKKAKAKDIEWNGVDDRRRIKREMTGAILEYSLLKKYGHEQHFDDSVVTKSSLKNHPDLLPLGVCCDIKGSSVNNVPLIFKTSRGYVCDSGNHKGKSYKCANIIGVTDSVNVWLLGIASPEVLQTYCDENLIMIAENTTKTGFFGFHKLIDLPSDWDLLKKLSWQLAVAS